MRQIGLDPKQLEKRAAGLIDQKREAYEANTVEGGEDGMEVDMDGQEPTKAKGVAGRKVKGDRRVAGFGTEEQLAKAQQLEKLMRRKRGRLGRAGEGDRRLVMRIDHPRGQRVDTFFVTFTVSRIPCPSGCSQEREVVVVPTEGKQSILHRTYHIHIKIRPLRALSLWTFAACISFWFLSSCCLYYTFPDGISSLWNTSGFEFRQDQVPAGVDD
jgi:hypothetical protein